MEQHFHQPPRLDQYQQSLLYIGPFISLEGHKALQASATFKKYQGNINNSSSSRNGSKDFIFVMKYGL